MGELIKKLSSLHEDYLRDESRKTGSAEYISFPKSEKDVIEVVAKVTASQGSLTIQGSRTGITGSSVPLEGTILNLSRMNNIGEIQQNNTTGETYISVEPGATLNAIREVAQKENLFFPPDPTETTASIGGMVACNASGAISYHYGATRKWINAINMILADGSTLYIKRGTQFADGRSFSIHAANNSTIQGSLPSYNIPDVKNASGYFIADNMDMIDLFIGMEGTLGIITKIELKLIEMPGAQLGLIAFLPSEMSAINFVDKIRTTKRDETILAAIEYFNNGTLNLLRSAQKNLPAFADLPPLPDRFHSAVYVAFHGNNSDALDSEIMLTAELIEALGGTADDCWCATTAQERDKLKIFRHATPELVNLKIDERRKNNPGLTKLGTDMSVPNAELTNIIQLYNKSLKALNLEYVIFGHIGDNHLHVNIIPRNIEEYNKGKELYLKWARQVVNLGGSVSAEHGIGKIKTEFLETMFGAAGIEEMKKLKLVFDPNNILNKGNLWHEIN